MESQILTEFTLRLKQSVVHIYSQGEFITSGYFKARKIQTPPPTIYFKSSEINSTRIRTSKPQKHVTKNVQTPWPEFLHFSLCGGSHTGVLVRTPMCEPSHTSRGAPDTRRTKKTAMRAIKHS